MAAPDSRTSAIWTPANVVTMVRICLVPVFVVALLSPWPAWIGFEDVVTEHVKSLVAAVLFIIISCTDWVDGYLARSRGEVTDFGKFMDPLADKILVAAALLALVEQGVLPSWPVLVILAREFIVSGVRMVAASKGEVIAASWWGKAKTVSQIVAIVLFLVKDLYWPASGAAGYELNPLYLLSWLAMLVALVLTVVSMLDYLVKARGLLGFGSDAAQQAPSAPDLEAQLARAAERLLAQATEDGLTLGTAESLTGGMACEALTAIPGSSAVVRGGVVSYAIGVKRAVLGVDGALLDQVGAVDGQVAAQMAEGARRQLGADVAMSTTGIAGPTGAEPGKPVGTVWVGCSSARGARAAEHVFEGDREQVRLQAALAALGMGLEEARALGGRR